MIKNQKRQKGGKRLLFISLGLIIIVGAGILSMYLTHSGIFSKQPDKSVSKAKQLTPEQVDQKVAEQQRDRLVKDIQSESDATKKAGQQAELAVTYYNDENYSKALETAKQAEASHASASTAALIAQTYFMLKDYKQSAKYYQVAMDRSEKPASPTERAPYNDYLSLKNEAEAKL